MRYSMRFRDRRDAGRQLAILLAEYADEDPVVLCLPRGGIVVGYEIAQALEAPLDVIVVRKLGVPYQPELGFGAIAPGGVRLLNDEIVEAVGLTEEEIEAVTEKETVELERRLRRYRGDSEPPDVRGRTAIIVDDGLATGISARAAIHAVRQLGARRVVLAAGVCASDTAIMLRSEVDDLVCVYCPRPFTAVGYWYENFEQTTDAEVVALMARAGHRTEDKPASRQERSVVVEAGGVELEADLFLAEDAEGLVIFAHGSGSTRRSSRNRFVADRLHEAGFATLLMDLLTPGESRIDDQTRHLRFDIPLLAERLVGAVRWATGYGATRDLPIGLFGASTGAAAALMAAAMLPDTVEAVVSRGGRPDLAEEHLARVRAPALLIVGGEDEPVIHFNREAQARMRVATDLVIVPGATHLFEEPGKLEIVASLAAEWFGEYLPVHQRR